MEQEEREIWFWFLLDHLWTRLFFLTVEETVQKLVQLLHFCLCIFFLWSQIRWYKVQASVLQRVSHYIYHFWWNCFNHHILLFFPTLYIKFNHKIVPFKNISSNIHQTQNRPNRPNSSLNPNPGTETFLWTRCTWYYCRAMWCEIMFTEQFPV